MKTYYAEGVVRTPYYSVSDTRYVGEGKYQVIVHGYKDYRAVFLYVSDTAHEQIQAEFHDFTSTRREQRRKLTRLEGQPVGVLFQ